MQSPWLLWLTVYDQYELIATEYAAMFPDDFEARPFDQHFVASFAELVLRSGGERALDAGCGPGQATAALARCGLSAEGVDGSPAMVAIARDRHPHLPFRVADMRELPYPAASFAAVSAWYSIIHTPVDVLPALFEEFSRVLADPGWLLLGFQTGAPTLTFDEAFGRKVSMEFLRHDVADVHDALRAASFTVYATATRSRLPGLAETADQAFVIARRSPVQVE
ncbi:class I SAM-dependent DNA methyltransferase [Mycolicibacterium mageritense]|uniref:Trans-aconitate 2-methyltransferase n=1 Tax=Mycolicibacterium mageritense TaxID=53462 RepID=A0AAI8TSZ5_MYCME|nr:class I SAM-dependent methyltransferase [Mycolicibacterium mageritense]BDY27992.1 Trans-aconitate 2-methyltransferase [Mycolicibacterium mageritense]GJJ21559.1 methyltransferase [Mycolicibacterium mageritense]